MDTVRRTSGEAGETSRFPTVELALPTWIDDLFPDPSARYPGIDDQVAVVIELAKRNVEFGTGGPFGAAVFDQESGRLLAPGVNLVVPSNAAIAHAEVVAIAVAGAAGGSFDLGAPGHPATSLVASTEPCAMCFGAVPWSGVSRLVCAARDEDARAIGFDEGPKMVDWESALTRRGIEVIRDVRRKESVEILQAYAQSGGLIYNGRQGD